ncbi:hypothetical protein TKK_0006810 [Trichogramma kaykai]
MKTCIITFDQPLYFKSRDIAGSLQMDRDFSIVIRLGGFHTLLSFLGSIGYIMKDSGLEEIAVDFEKEIDSLEKQNPTTKLWIQYCRMVFIVKDFIYAEKSGDWDLIYKQ